MSKTILKVLLFILDMILQGRDIQFRCITVEGSRLGLSRIPKPSPTRRQPSDKSLPAMTVPDNSTKHAPEFTRPGWIDSTWLPTTWEIPSIPNPNAENLTEINIIIRRKTTWRRATQSAAIPEQARHPSPSIPREWRLYPSFSPYSYSDEPSSSTSDFYSTIPSPTSSFTPTRQNSQLISSIYTSVPSDRSSDNFGDTMILSKNPSDDPSDLPSRHQSSFPSFSPSSSIQPSMFPSLLPTLSNIPTREPSIYPSDFPSLTPSGIPTIAPTPTPSIIPTLSPSITPSSFPSLACHDEADYRSPLNNFTCRDHFGTDCTNWKYLGLTEDEVEALIRSCPVSCQVQCDSLERFDINASYVISNVDNFLAPESVNILEQTSVAYFTKFIEAEEPDAKFSLQRVELLSQSIISKTTSGLRSLDSAIDLSVSCAFNGFSIDIDPKFIETYILDGIESRGFLNAMHSSGDATFASVDINLIAFNDTDSDTQKSVQQHTRSLRAIPASIVCGLLAITLSGAVLFYKVQRKRRSYLQDKDDVSEHNSPHAYARSPLLEVFSFESVIRLVSSAGSHPSDLATSKEMTSGSESSQVLSVHSNQILAAAPVESNVCDEILHPLTGIVPPMIIFDLSGESNHKNNNQSQFTKCVVPYRKVEASESFRKSICIGGELTLDESMYDGVVQNDPGEFLESYMWTSSIDSENSDSEHDSPSHRLQAKSRESASSLSELPNLRISVSESAMDDFANDEHRRTFRSFKLRRKRSLLDNQTSGKLSSPRDAELWSCEITGINCRPGMITHRSVSDAIVPVAKSDTDRRSMIAGLNLLKSIRSLSARNLVQESAADHDASKNCQLVSFASNVSDNDKQKMLIFWAPVRGKLGLIIQCLADIGPIVTQVKDYSPLLGHVLEGDRIVEIDDVSTIGMDINEVLLLLSNKQSLSHLSMLRLVVWRTEKLELDSDASDH